MSKAPVPAIVFADIDSAPPIRAVRSRRSPGRAARDAGRPPDHARPLLAPDARRSGRHPPGARHLSSVRVRERRGRVRAGTLFRLGSRKHAGRSAATRRSSSGRRTSRSSRRCAAWPIACSLRCPGIPRHVGRTGVAGTWTVPARRAAGEAARVQRALPAALGQPRGRTPAAQGALRRRTDVRDARTFPPRRDRARSPARRPPC